MSSADDSSTADNGGGGDDSPTISLSVSTLDKGAALDKAAETTQLHERHIGTDIGRGIRPPYPPAYLAAFQELNETHHTCIRKKARYEVGYGFDIVKHPGVRNDPSEDEYDTVFDFWFGTDSSWQIGPEGTAAATPEEVLELARQDYHSIGWAALEILVEGDGTPTGLAHVPARTVRIRKKGTTDDGNVIRGHGYVQVRGAQTRYFGEAGDRYRDDPTYVDRDTGETADDPTDLPNGPANELIFVPNPSPLTTYYGLPDWIPATQTMAADQAAKEWNNDIFEHLGIPYYAVKVTGGKLTEDSKDELRELMDNLKGSRYRTAILEVDEFETEGPLETEDGNDVEIELVPIGSREDLDMEFQTFRERAEHKIAQAHEVPPILINNTDSSNRANSKEQVREFAEDIIAPEQSKFEARLYRIIHQQALGVSDWTIDFELRGADRAEAEARLAEKKIRAVNGAIPLNWALEVAGWDPIPDDHPVDGSTLLADVGGQGEPGQDEPPDDVEGQLPPPENKLGERDWDEVEPELAEKEIEQTRFDSSNLFEGLYDFEDQELYLSFRRENGSNSLYAYVNVPPTQWAALVNAGSHGSYHYHNIRLEFPYVEITNFHDRLPEGPSPDPDEMPDDIPL